MITPTAIIAAAISGDALVNALIWIVVLGIVFWLLNWMIGYVGLPAPFAKVAKVIIAVVAVLMLINILLGLVGKPLVSW